MDTRKLTESAVLSALFVMTGILFITSVIGYQIFLDFIAPIMSTLIYLRCDFKYTLLSSITTLILMTLILGNPAVSIWMIQSLAIGFVCGALIKKSGGLSDDLLICSLFAAIVLIFIDIFFSGIIGTSMMKEAEETLSFFEVNGSVANVIFYIFIAALPLGTIIMTYIAGLLLGKKLRLLNENAMRKFFFVRKYRKYGNLQYCSQKTMLTSLIYIILVMILEKTNILFNFTYLKTVLITMKYIIIYFIIKDSYSLLCTFINRRYKNLLLSLLFQGGVLYSLFRYFIITALSLTIGAILIDLKFNVRINIEKYLRNLNFKPEL